MRSPVRWLKYPHTVWWTISVLGVHCALRMWGAVSSFSMKQSSSFMVFSPMHTASRNKLAITLGSSPYILRSQSQKINSCYVGINISYVCKCLIRKRSSRVVAQWFLGYSRVVWHLPRSWFGVYSDYFTIINKFFTIIFFNYYSQIV